MPAASTAGQNPGIACITALAVRAHLVAGERAAYSNWRLEMAGIGGSLDTETEFSVADLAYIRAEYRTIEELCSSRSETPGWLMKAIKREKLTQPAYVLPDGGHMFPLDYFVLLDHARDIDELPFYFHDRYVLATQSAGLNPGDAGEVWADYLSGMFGICLRSVTPESIAKKGQLIDLIECLVSAPDPGDHTWRTVLRSSVDALDDLERPFTDYARRRWGESSRDRYITATRARYPVVFHGESGLSG
jgi:uncharacterized protein DUF6058